MPRDGIMALRFTLRQLEYLIAVGESGSVAAAAERVGVSPPSVSVAVSQIEAQLGLILFVRRHAQGLSPTQAGRQVMDQARLILTEAARLNDIASEITGVVRGRLRVGGLLTFAQVVLPQVRRGFQAAYPGIEVDQSGGDQDELFDGLRRARIDVALTYDLNIPADLHFEALASLPPYAILPEGHALAGAESLSPSDLLDHPMVLLDLPHSVDYFLSAFAPLGAKPKVAERIRDIQVMRSLVANGFGWSLANIRPVSDRAPDGLPLCFVPMTGIRHPVSGCCWLRARARFRRSGPLSPMPARS